MILFSINISVGGCPKIHSIESIELLFCSISCNSLLRIQNIPTVPLWKYTFAQAMLVVVTVDRHFFLSELEQKFIKEKLLCCWCMYLYLSGYFYHWHFWLLLPIYLPESFIKLTVHNFLVHFPKMGKNFEVHNISFPMQWRITKKHKGLKFSPYIYLWHKFSTYTNGDHWMLPSSFWDINFGA